MKKILLIVAAFVAFQAQADDELPQPRPKLTPNQEAQQDMRRGLEEMRRRRREGVLVTDEFGNVRNLRTECLAAQKRTGVITVFCMRNGWFPGAR